MSTNKTLLLTAIIAIFLCSCSNRHYYLVALQHAQNPTPDKVYDKLTEISHSNDQLIWKTINGKQYVLVATWTADTPAYNKIGKYDSSNGLWAYNTKDHKIWVTLDPYLKEEPYKNMSDKKLDMRLKQLIGLPPTSVYNYFLEVWVRPEDVVRPCFDPATNTNVCEFTPSEKDKLNITYSYWLYQYLYNSYSNPDRMKRYPFSHLGYTYDWNHKNRSHVGLSEFVIDSYKDVYVNRVYTTRQYFNN